ncbi:uncharacterized protein LOC123632744 [Lemur catta]|uniref:uncharacterized protein LOC123632744 n=1 Tax=Lemur catta TaxID=9447 RepID=UPI001E26BC00|nr:uncharacterized protein LOC123632744 [Lemur catta]
MKLHLYSVSYMGTEDKHQTRRASCSRRGPETPAPLLHSLGNLLFHLEHQAEHTALGLILLNCQVERHLKATETYVFTILTPGVEGTAYKLAAEKQEELGAGWGELEAAGCAATLHPQAHCQELCQAVGQEPSSTPEGCGFLATLSTPSSFQELHEHFGKESQVLQVVHRKLQASDSGGRRSQPKLEQELNQCLLMSDQEMDQRPRDTYSPSSADCFNRDPGPGSLPPSLILAPTPSSNNKAGDQGSRYNSRFFSGSSKRRMGWGRERRECKHWVPPPELKEKTLYPDRGWRVGGNKVKGGGPGETKQGRPENTEQGG